ncbi:MAG: dihydrodipicolinate synthase family protein [Anaerolineae bacterium]|nr:dihydrodipicolinate synthase family protein [Anaerolineae bacterium]
MPEQSWHGSFAIPMTPYTDDDHIDVDVLAAEIAFCVENGVGGIPTPLMVSEFRSLSEEERKLMMRVAVEVSAGRAPVIGNVAAVNTPLAVQYAEYAQKIGVDGVIAMPPYIHKPDFPKIYAYYKAIAEAVTVPVWIQNASVAPLSADQLVQLCEEIENVSWVKEEVPPSTQNITRLLEKHSPAIHGVMGGGGGRPLLEEYERGSMGCVHACQYCDVLQRVWELLDAGEKTAAYDLFEHLLPSLMLEGMLGMAYAKEIMVRRGIFKNHAMRNTVKPLDEYDMSAIDRTWERIQPYLVWNEGKMVDSRKVTV